LNTVSIANATYTLIPNMSLAAVPAGEFIVMFSASALLTANGATCDYAIFAGGTIVDYSERSYIRGGGGAANALTTVALHTQALVTGGVTIDVRAVTGGGATCTINERSLYVFRVQRL
jgi:hypothetical protein